MLRTRTWTALPATVALLAVPAAAGADTYCVASASCTGAAEPSLAQALGDAKAHAGRDTVEIGPVTVDGALTDDDPAGVDIVGSGSGSGGTLLTISGASNSFTAGFMLSGNSSSTISHLAVHVPDGNANIGLDTDAAVSDVSVGGAAASTYVTGVLLRAGGSLAHSQVRLPLASGGSVAVIAGDGSHVSDTTIAAPTGVEVTGSNASVTLDRVSIDAYEGARIEDQHLTVRDSLIHAEAGGHGADPGTFGIFATVQGGATDPFLHTEGITVVGPGTPGSIGIEVNGQEGVVRDSIVNGFEKSFAADSLGAPNATLATDYSSYETSAASTSTPDVTVTESHRLTADPGFSDPAAGDYTLRSNSGLVESGDPAGLAPGEAPLDLAGNPRIADANGDGIAVRDVGAYEWQRPPDKPAPVLPSPPDLVPPRLSGVSETNSVFAVAGTATPVSARVRLGTTFRFVLSEPSRVRLAIRRKLAGRRVHGACRKPGRRARGPRCVRYVRSGTLTRGGSAGPNAVPFSGRVGRRALKPGSYSVSITAVDASGNSSRAAALSFRIVPAKRR